MACPAALESLVGSPSLEKTFTVHLFLAQKDVHRVTLPSTISAISRQIFKSLHHCASSSSAHPALTPEFTSVEDEVVLQSCGSCGSCKPNSCKDNNAFPLAHHCLTFS